MNMIEALYNALRLPELRNKILFTGGMLVIFRLFANVTIPNVTTAALSNLFNSQALLGLLDLFSGGGLARFSIVAIGQAYGYTVLFQNANVLQANMEWFQRLSIMITLTSGTILAMWLGELIT